MRAIIYEKRPKLAKQAFHRCFLRSGMFFCLLRGGGCSLYCGRIRLVLFGRPAQHASGGRTWQFQAAFFGIKSLPQKFIPKLAVTPPTGAPFPSRPHSRRVSGRNRPSAHSWLQHRGLHGRRHPDSPTHAIAQPRLPLFGDARNGTRL